MHWERLPKKQISEAKKKGKEIRWAITADSESADHYGPYILSKEPTQDELKRISANIESVDEDSEGPGDFGTWLYLKISQCIVDSILEE